VTYVRVIKFLNDLLSDLAGGDDIVAQDYMNYLLVHIKCAKLREQLNKRGIVFAIKAHPY